MSRSVASARERSPIRRIALVGNGVRLTGLAEALERALDATAEIAVSPLFEGDAYPNDVVRAAAADWTLAAALAAWGSA